MRTVLLKLGPRSVALIMLPGAGIGGPIAPGPGPARGGPDFPPEFGPVPGEGGPLFAPAGDRLPPLLSGPFAGPAEFGLPPSPGEAEFPDEAVVDLFSCFVESCFASCLHSFPNTSLFRSDRKSVV